MDYKEIGKRISPMFEIIANDAELVLKALGLPHDATILDVGTGSGNSAIFLALQGFNVLTGEPETDTSQYARKDWAIKAQEIGVENKISFKPFDANDMPFQANIFDAVFFFGVLHHVDENKRVAAFREALRVSKEKGAVVFFEPTAETLEKIWATNPTHPQAANPSRYLSNKKITEEKLTGSMMDIFIYKNAA